MNHESLNWPRQFSTEPRSIGRRSSRHPTRLHPHLLNHLQVVAAIADLHRSAADALDSRPVPRVHPGGQWGHLRLLECIARGAFGEVYRAWDTRLDREVALKLLPAAGVSTERGASSIIHEGRLLARVRHPNVVTIYGAEQIDDRIGLWMEYVRGRTLEQILKQGATFTAIETARIGAEICKAISAVHAAGLLHRDIKAQNVMLADDGRVVLMDFGAGREFDDGAATDLAGTPLYLAPEVFRGQRATAQSDIYSLGVLLFHLVSRGYPVHARTTADLRLAHERGVRTPLRATRGEVPAALVRVIDRAMHPVPTLRYGTADELGRELVALNRRSRTLPAFYVGVALATALLVVSVPLARPGRLPSPRDCPSGHPSGYCSTSVQEPQCRRRQRRVRRRPHLRDPPQSCRNSRSGTAVVCIIVFIQRRTAALRYPRTARCGLRSRRIDSPVVRNDTRAGAVRTSRGRHHRVGRQV